LSKSYNYPRLFSQSYVNPELSDWLRQPRDQMEPIILLGVIEENTKRTFSIHFYDHLDQNEANHY